MSGGECHEGSEPSRRAEVAMLLRRLRLRSGLTQRELAELAGLSYRTVSDLERGVIAFPRRDTAQMLADALGLPPRERAAFLDRSRRPPPGLGVAGRFGIGADRVASSLPFAGTPLFGRNLDVSTLVAMLREPSTRLVTVVGTGGIGKTRLAIEVARVAEPGFAVGALLVRLDGLARSHQVLPAVAAGLGSVSVGEGVGDQIRAISATLEGRTALLVLDNMEHLLDAADDLVTLLRAAPGIVLLVTSREALRLEDERVYALKPLQCHEGHTTDRTAGDGPAVELFVHRAGRTCPSLSFDPSTPSGRANRLLAHDVCALLDGLPLAIELAAAQLEQVPLPALGPTIRESGLPVLSGGERGRPERLRTMEGAIGWSYWLLSDTARAMLRRLSVCAGTFDLVAVVAVSEMEDDGDASRRLATLAVNGTRVALPYPIIRALSELLRAHLVAPEPAWNPDLGEPWEWPRFRLLEPIRMFALDRLRESGDEELARRRHARYFADLVELLDQRSLGPEPRRWLGRIEADLDNIRSAQDWAAERGDGEVAARSGAYLASFLLIRGMHGEAKQRIATASALVGECPLPLGWFIGYWSGVVASLQDDDEGCLSAAEQIRALALTGNDRLGVAVAAALRSQALQRVHGRVEDAVAQAKVAVTLVESLNEPVWFGWMLARLALATQANGDPQAAFFYSSRAAEVRRRAGCELYLPFSLVGLGSISLDLGDFLAAIDFHQDAYELAVRNGDAWLLFFTFLGMAELASFMATSDGEARQSALLAFGAATELCVRHGYASAARSRELVSDWLECLPRAPSPQDLDEADRDIINRGRLLDADDFASCLDALRAIARALPRPGIARRSRLPRLVPGLD